jgi:hypothetical protein
MGEDFYFIFRAWATSFDSPQSSGPGPTKMRVDNAKHVLHGRRVSGAGYIGICMDAGMIHVARYHEVFFLNTTLMYRERSSLRARERKCKIDKEPSPEEQPVRLYPLWCLWTSAYEYLSGRF